MLASYNPFNSLGLHSLFEAALRSNSLLGFFQYKKVLEPVVSFLLFLCPFLQYALH